MLSKLLGLVLLIQLALSRKYFFVKQGKSWLAARQYCKSQFGTDLASLSSQNDVATLKKLVGANNVWIGLKQTTSGAGKKASDFSYVDGSNSNFKPFYPGEPNNAGGEDCVEFYGHYGKLNDLKCSRSKYFVCNMEEDGKKYYTVNKYETWANANNYCKKVYGTELATFENEADYYNFKNAVGSVDYWVGLKQTAPGPGKSANDFTYVDDPDKSNKFKPFNKGEPNNAGGEDCVHYSGGSKLLNDLKCTRKLKIVCNAETYMVPKKYIYIPKKLTWKLANNYCKNVYGSTLATFRNGVDFYSFEQLIKNKQQSIWVGLYQKNKKIAGKDPLDFIYVDGTKSVYRPFGPGEPNNLGGEDCIEFRKNTQLLNDLKCSTPQHFVCNLPIEVDIKNYIDPGVGSKSFTQGNAICKARYGTTLATFRHGRDYVEFEKLAKGRSTWVGLYSKIDKSDFGYIDGSKSKYKPFGPGEPNNANGEDCVEYVGSLKLLNDLKCSNSRYIICNKKGSPTNIKPDKPDVAIYVPTPMTFEEANQYCIDKYDTEMVAVNNLVDHQLVRRTCKASNGLCWIGLSDLKKYSQDPEDWWFTDGSVGDYNGWATNQPSRNDGKSCAYMNNAHHGKWFVASTCQLKLPFICSDGGNDYLDIIPRARQNGNLLNDNSNKLNKNLFEINYGNWHQIFNVKYVYVTLAAMFIIFISLIGALIYVSCKNVKPKKNYNRVSYIGSSDSDDQV